MQMKQDVIKQALPIMSFLEKKKCHPYEIVTIMIQMAQIVDDFHKIHNKILGRFKLRDFTIQKIPNTKNYRVKFIGQPQYDKQDKIQGQSNNESQQIYEAPDLYDKEFDYQCDIYQLGVWFAFMIANKYINYNNAQELDTFQEYMPQVTWVIQTMLDKLPYCRPGLEVVIDRLLKFEFKGKIVINQGTFIVEKRNSYKILNKQQQIYYLTQDQDIQQDIDKDNSKIQNNDDTFLHIQCCQAKNVRVQFINCFQSYKFSPNRDRYSNIINTIIRIKPKEIEENIKKQLEKNKAKIEEFDKYSLQEKYILEEKQYKNQYFEAYFFQQQQKILVFQFKLKSDYLEKDELDINYRLKIQFSDQKEFCRLKYLDCYIHILDIQQILEKYEDKDNLKNQARLQIIWHKKQLLRNQSWNEPQFFWKIKSIQTVEGLFQLIEPETQIDQLKEQNTSNTSLFVTKFLNFLLYLKNIGLTLRRLSFENHLQNQFKENLPINCIHLRNFNEKAYQCILKKFYRISIDQIQEQIFNLQDSINDLQKINNQEIKTQVQQMESDKSNLAALKDELLYKLNYN